MPRYRPTSLDVVVEPDPGRSGRCGADVQLEPACKCLPGDSQARCSSRSRSTPDPARTRTRDRPADRRCHDQRDEAAVRAHVDSDGTRRQLLIASRQIRLSIPRRLAFAQVPSTGARNSNAQTFEPNLGPPQDGRCRIAAPAGLRRSGPAGTSTHGSRGPPGSRLASDARRRRPRWLRRVIRHLGSIRASQRCRVWHSRDASFQRPVALRPYRRPREAAQATGGGSGVSRAEPSAFRDDSRVERRTPRFASGRSELRNLRTAVPSPSRARSSR